MSYQALARKWRPRRFEDVIGQEHVVSALTNALDNQQVHHAFLFTGTRGVGKTTLARIFAKALNCEVGMSATPCGECNACLGVDQGNFIDLIEVDAASRTKVDDTRELLDNVQYAPTLGRYKIYLIDEVHMLSTHSFNALLKTLEEPPQHVKFLLATTDPQKLPATILSRCIQFNLKTMDIARLNGQIEKILKSEAISSDPEARMILARAADGSVRDALSLLDQAIAFGNGEVRTEQVRNMLGMIENHFTQKILQHICAGESAELLDTIADMSERSVDYKAALDDILSMLHNISLHQVSPKALEWKGVDITALSALETIADSELLQLLYQIGLIGKRDLGMAPDPRSGFEMVMLRMVAFQPNSQTTAQPAPQSPRTETGSSGARIQRTLPTQSAPPIADKASEVESNNVHPITAPAIETPISKIDDPTPLQKKPDSTDISELASGAGWSAFVERANLRGISKELMMNMVPTSVNGNSLDLVLDQSSSHLFNESRLQKLEQQCSEYLGSDIRFNVTVDTVTVVTNGAAETPSQEKNRKAEERQQSAEQAFGSDPNVQELVDLFDAEVVSGSIQPAPNS